MLQQWLGWSPTDRVRMCCSGPFAVCLDYYSCQSFNAFACADCLGLVSCEGCCDCAALANWGEHLTLFDSVGGECFVAVLVVALTLLAIFGACWLTVGCCAWTCKVGSNYFQLLEIRAMTQEYIVQDLADVDLPTVPPAAETLQPTQTMGDATEQENTETEDIDLEANPTPAADIGVDVVGVNVPRSHALVLDSLSRDMQVVYGYQALPGNQPQT